MIVSMNLIPTLHPHPHLYNLTNVWKNIRGKTMSLFHLCNYRYSGFTSSGVQDITFSLSSLTQLLAFGILSIRLKEKGKKTSRSLLGSLPLPTHAMGVVWEHTHYSDSGEKVQLLRHSYLKDAAEKSLIRVRSRWHPISCLGHRKFLVRLCQVWLS